MDVNGIVVETGGYRAVTPWEDEKWRAQALGWITERLARHRLVVGGDQVWARLRPWSVVLRVPLTEGGAVWFKANPPRSAYEPAVMAALHRWVPGRVVEPVAVDTARAWSLLPDAGPMFTEVLTNDPEDLGAWAEMLSQYAQLQREVEPHANKLLAMGVPDFRPQRLVERYRCLVESAGSLRDEERRTLRAATPRFEEWCQRLAESPVACSLDQSDLHPASVLTGGRALTPSGALADGGRYLFFDWGDSSVTHPFASLLVVGRVLDERFDRDPAARTRAWDAYLDAWAERGTGLPELRALAEVACRVAAVCRADTWDRVFPSMLLTTADRDAHIARWLRELL
ncbi:aminoglycoside phosphotransferase family protein [Streptomyces sp. 3MP-14]|uniref:Aminoglycoside phosphotransferase family protein n=1 Tax=Streptomyces mimosae TaxID=2586635 RepID=A0A5N6A8Y7_9ACTN|nr:MULTISPECIES: aminoglycoside phosphotransferase family protein [Streptomyces]KAB8164220.1 aminoglycoside phosphotransferase family protein [Streptomyces mimosae]KAB8176497.1 aminoglycoside phosphotransferase family protein [Streptomyces sp. 3MP-14]